MILMCSSATIKNATPIRSGEMTYTCNNGVVSVPSQIIGTEVTIEIIVSIDGKFDNDKAQQILGELMKSLNKLNGEKV